MALSRLTGGVGASVRMRAHRLRTAMMPFALATAIALAVAVACACPRAAYAYFNDVADSYPAAQELGTFDRPIYGSELPSGSYQVTARTSSRMCIMYTNPENAEARDSKEQAIVLVDDDGAMTAVFYLSKAYTHMYLGTQEEAASLTDEEGLDASAYIAGDPDEGYVPHMFALPISALNTPMTISTYSGGDKGVEKGRWYTREFIFGMTEAELEAYAVGNEDEPTDPDSGNGNEDDDTKDDATFEEDDTGAEDDDVDAEDDETVEDEPAEEEQDDTEEEPRGQIALNTESVVAGSGDGSGGGGSGSGSQVGAGDSGQGAKRAGNEAGTTMRGVRMRIVGSDGALEIETPKVEAPAEPERPLLTKQQVVALAVAGIFLAGIAAGGVLFARRFERSTAPPTSPRKKRSNFRSAW